MFPFSRAYHKTAVFPSSSASSQYLPLSGADVGEQSWPKDRPRSSSILTWRTAALCELLIIILSFGLFFKFDRTQYFPYSLVRDAIHYETRVLHNSVGRDLSPYQGRPSPDLDELWFNTYAGGIFKITKEEERRLPNRTSAIPGDTEHYITTLAVFHHLHCLNYVRKTLYPDYYSGYDLKNATVLEHTEHCIDVLREALMCSPDITAGSWQWFPRDQRSIPTWDIAHTCVKYEEIQAWAMSRALYEYDETVWVEGNPIHN